MKEHVEFRGEIYRGWTIRHPRAGKYIVSSLIEPDTLESFSSVRDAREWVDRWFERREKC